MNKYKNSPSLLAIICARGGSKGIPQKNVMNLYGKPLIAWTIESAKQSKFITRCVLSSDDPEIMEVAKCFGCEVPFVRPKELALDDTPGIAPVLHAIDKLPFHDYVMLLQPTSPLRVSEDIDNSFKQCVTMDAPACVSVTQASAHPFLTFELRGINNELKPFSNSFEVAVARQKLPKAYILNGAIYLAKTEWLLETKSFLTDETVGYIMPEDRSIDVDKLEDLILAEHHLKRLYPDNINYKEKWKKE